MLGQRNTLTLSLIVATMEDDMTTRTISRRSVLAGAAAAIPAAVALAAIAFAAVGGDGELIDLCRQCLDASRAVADAEALSTAVSRAYEGARLERPDTLRITEIDRGYWDNLSKPDDGFPNAGYFGVGEVESIRKHDRKNLAAVKSNPPEHPLALQPIPKGEPTGEFPVDHVLVVRRNGESSQEHGARADEIVAAWDAWHGTDEAVSRRCGVEAGEKGAAAAWETRDLIAWSIAELPAVTVAGLKAKAGVIIAENDGVAMPTTR